MKIDEGTAELIAIGASVTANCKGCVDHHRARAHEVGVTEEAIADALEVGWMVRRGAAAQLQKALATVGAEAPGPTTARRAGCCG